ncbi:tetratricopeptide repeat protein [Salaquimonas pukyongi]|uniref:tetratricopeptide repeat protein n=1 Tax=Salaquimonas pukyongi TaxID=2712698 RepID=UPI00096B76D1|nr:tetratricopeptide repeat protein [Salaquimonas pukyongi]
MADDDTFIREVDEQMRQDRAQELWSRYGRFVIAGAVAIVLATAGYRAWDYYNQQRLAGYGDRFMSAIELSGRGKHDEAVRALEALAAEGGGRYPELARLRIAGEMVARGEKAEALKAFDALANDSAAMPALRETAQLQAGLLAVDLEAFSSVESRLSSLAGAGHPLRHSAREALAIAALKAGEDSKALEWLSRIVEDSEAAQGVQSRARLLLDHLAGKGVTAEG